MTDNNIFKGLSFQQKKGLLTSAPLKTEQDFKQLGQAFAQTVQNNVDTFGMWDLSVEMLALQEFMGNKENNVVS
jgi:hypothetical protein